MYVTRPLSMYKRNPGALSDPPPAGPNSGYLVIFDEEAQTYSCFGLCKDNNIRDLPFPQNKNLTINYSSDDEEALFVPVLNQPLSSNRYYVIRRKGKHQGNYHLGEALGSNHSLRAKLPDFNFPISNDRSESVVVGKWYCPFMFVKEGIRLKEQMKKSVFYELTLEQRWEKIFSKETNGVSGENHAVLIDVVVQTEVAKVAGKEAVWDENGVDGRVVWFKSIEDVASETSVGLSLEIVDGMKWEQERVGWISGNERQVRVERVEEFGGINRWRKFGCYVLVESFVLKRMDRGLVIAYDYRHTHQIRCKWE
ncbi:hypothetical protein E2542_SST05720 [Spatholobus suberectus]|nr:hypothetical protein E2542_SST05720 [Spatholobus suberectus]